MKTTKVFVKKDGVVLYGEWPEYPNYCQAYTAEDRYCVLCSTGKGCEGEKIKYEQALKKAISEAVPFKDQDKVLKLIRDRYFKALYLAEPIMEPGFYDIQAEVDIEELCDCERSREAGISAICFMCTGKKKLAVIKPTIKD